MDPVEGIEPDDEWGEALAAAVRSRRERAGLTQSGLARLASLSAGTLSALEAGGSNPRIGTLRALARVFGCEVGDLLAEVADPMVCHVPAGTGVALDGSVAGGRLLQRFSPNGPVEIYEADLPSGPRLVRNAHGEGVYEHVWLARGRLQVGPEDSPISLRSGDYVCYRAWTRHIYHPGAGGARFLVILSYTRSVWFSRGLLGHGLLRSAE